MLDAWKGSALECNGGRRDRVSTIGVLERCSSMAVGDGQELTFEISW